jgi:predicted metalloprotease
MQLDGPGSDNIEDRRDESGGGGFGGGGFPVSMGGGGGGGGGVFTGGLGLVAVVVLALVFGVDPSQLLGGLTGGQPTDEDSAQTLPSAPPARNSRQASTSPSNQDPAVQFVSKVLGSTERVWSDLFGANYNARYVDPKLVLYRGATRTACGQGEAAMGPFYCPADRRVYLDLGFFDEMAQRFHAPGQFPQAYVIAHEVGHHVQNLLGISDKVAQARTRMSKRDGNAMSVRVELQADCFAGVWAHHANQAQGGTMIGASDVEQALAAATAIGDDRLQKQAQGYVVPDSFTHGSSAQRVRWFKRGLESGNMKDCDTFRAQQL